MNTAINVLWSCRWILPTSILLLIVPPEEHIQKTIYSSLVLSQTTLTLSLSRHQFLAETLARLDGNNVGWAQRSISDNMIAYKYANIDWWMWRVHFPPLCPFRFQPGVHHYLDISRTWSTLILAVLYVHWTCYIKYQFIGYINDRNSRNFELNASFS